MWKTSEKRIKQKRMETKSPFSQIKNTAECHSSRLEQVEDTTPELKNKTDIK
jgi:hypothetical protein